MRLWILFALLMIPTFALAQEADDYDDDDAVVEDSVITEVEGANNTVIVIEELVINVNANDIVSSEGGGGQDAMGMVYRLLDMLQSGMGHGGDRRSGGSDMHGMGHPPMDGMGGPRMPMDRGGNPGGPGPDRFSGKGGPGMEGDPHGGMLPMVEDAPPEVRERLMRFMFAVGRLAMENEEFRMQVMELVEQHRSQGERKRSRFTPGGPRR